MQSFKISYIPELKKLLISYNAGNSFYWMRQHGIADFFL